MLIVMLEWGRKSAGSAPVLQDETVVAYVRVAALRERADVEIGATHWQFFKRGGELHAVRDDQAAGMTASRRSVFRQGWQIEADAQTYQIQPEGFLQTRYRVVRAGIRIGQSNKASFWSNRPTLEVDASVPLEHQVFLLWVAFIMRKRAAGAATGATAGGGGGGGAGA